MLGENLLGQIHDVFRKRQDKAVQQYFKVRVDCVPNPVFSSEVSS